MISFSKEQSSAQASQELNSNGVIVGSEEIGSNLSIISSSISNSDCKTQFPIQVDESEDVWPIANSNIGDNRGETSDCIGEMLKARDGILSWNAVLWAVCCTVVVFGLWKLWSSTPSHAVTPRKLGSTYNLTLFSNPGCHGEFRTLEVNNNTCTDVEPKFQAKSAMAFGEGCLGMKLSGGIKCIIGPWTNYWILCGECINVDLVVESIECP